jgi:hypothetical protein
MMLLIGMLRVSFRGGQKKMEKKIAFSTRQYAAASSLQSRRVTRKTEDTKKGGEKKRKKNEK